MRVIFHIRINCMVVKQLHSISQRVTRATFVAENVTMPKEKCYELKSFKGNATVCSMKLADQEYKFKVRVRKLRQSHRHEPEKKEVTSEYDIYFSRDFKLGE